MKTSDYNYFIPYKEGHIFFNGITKRFFLASEKNHAKLMDIISRPGYYGEKYAPFLERMLVEGFVVEDDVQEMDIIRDEFDRKRNSDQYTLMILPTYDCNLRCWYCIQEHQNMTLSDETVARIKKHIEKYLLKNEIKELRLSWFGGEPLLAYRKLIEITRYSKDFCECHHIGFFSDMTTNSLLLTPERIKELGGLGVRSFQITIDGCREKHNQVKRDKDNAAFDKAVNNVLEIVKTIPDSYCILRINYSDQTLEPGKIMHDVNLMIPHEYRKQIKISPCKIWQVEDRKIKAEKVGELNSIAKRKNYQIQTSLTNFCYVDHTHFNCIFPNGNVGKCDNEKPEDAKGVLTESGDILWKTEYRFIQYHQLSSGSECVECKYLPFCMGPCPRRREDMYVQHKHIVCQHQDKEEAMKRVIVDYCEKNSDFYNI